MQEHAVSPATQYVNWRGRGVQEVRQEKALHAALAAELVAHPQQEGETAEMLRARLRRFAETSGYDVAPRAHAAWTGGCRKSCISSAAPCC